VRHLHAARNLALGRRRVCRENKTETTVFKIKDQTEFYSPTYSCAYSVEQSSKLNSQPPWLANQLEILSRRKSKDECYDPQIPDKQESSLYHPFFPFHSR
jgi:hypothetical protein